MFAIVGLMLLMLTGCGKEKVELTVWSPPEDRAAIQEAVDSFKYQYKNDADFEISIQDESISGIKKLIINGALNVADVYRYADDQVTDLINTGALKPVNFEIDKTVEENGGYDTDVIKSVTKDSNIYGYPATASNGFFLYYNKEYLNEDDVKTLDGIINKCNEQGKYLAMDFSSGWYTYSFFGGAGMSITMNEDNTKNVCDFNRKDGKYTGVDVANAMLDALKSDGFRHIAVEEMINRIDEGEDIAAIISGTWDYMDLYERWGDNLAATKLPTYTIKGNQEQMYSFFGYTYYGVHKDAKNPEWSEKLARWLTNYDTQLRRYEVANDCPSNLEAADSEIIKKSPAVSALNLQRKYSVTQRILEPYWDPMTVFSSFIVSGNPDDIDIQKLLDETVESITR